MGLKTISAHNGVIHIQMSSDNRPIEVKILQLTLFAVLFGIVMSRLMRAYRDGDDKNENHKHEDGREKNGDQIDSTLMHKVQQ